MTHNSDLDSCFSDIKSDSQQNLRPDSDPARRTCSEENIFDENECQDLENIETWNTLRSPQRAERSALLSSCYFSISICVGNASITLYFYRNMILIYNRRELMTASSVIVRKISLAAAYTMIDSL